MAETTQATIDKDGLNAMTAVKPQIADASITFEIPAYENFGKKTIKVNPKKAYAVFMKLMKDERVD